MTMDENPANPVLEIIKNWLEEQTAAFTPSQTQDSIEKAYKATGYGHPFDSEQRDLNALLAQENADELSCLVAWGYYHDAKMALAIIEAKKKA